MRSYYHFTLRLYSITPHRRRTISLSLSSVSLSPPSLPLCFSVPLADPTAQEAVFGLLLPHFRRFYELDEGLTTPIKLEACTVLTAESFRVVEPLQVRVLYAPSQHRIGSAVALEPTSTPRPLSQPGSPRPPSFTHKHSRSRLVCRCCCTSSSRCSCCNRPRRTRSVARTQMPPP